MRDWVVGAALVWSGDHLLLVRNRRRNGREDWSPPGGVIEHDEGLLAGLAREVHEETGLTVTDWAGPVYEVRCEAPEMDWRLRVEVHLALAFHGELHVDDPDGIVVEARFIAPGELDTHLVGNQRWVVEPLVDWLAERWDHSEMRPYAFHVAGAPPGDVVVTRAEA